jgi:hypothetical protein
MTRLWFSPLVVLLLTGCASTDAVTPTSSAATTPRAQCENTGGQWRAGVCEKSQGGGGGY